MVTLSKGIVVGTKVRVLGHAADGVRTVVEVYDQKQYPGGVRLNRPVGPDKEFGMFVSWNEDELQVMS